MCCPVRPRQPRNRSPSDRSGSTVRLTSRTVLCVGIAALLVEVGHRTTHSARTKVEPLSGRPSESSCTVSTDTNTLYWGVVRRYPLRLRATPRVPEVVRYLFCGRLLMTPSPAGLEANHRALGPVSEYRVWRHLTARLPPSPRPVHDGPAPGNGPPFPTSHLPPSSGRRGGGEGAERL